MAQSLLIGLGGTGSRVVNNVVKELQKNGETFNNGKICCAVLDTNVNDNQSITDSHTGIPVFPTSKPKKIRDYLDEYHYLGVDDWCPASPAFLEGSMIDGCSEIRVKSRLAFMDCIETGVTQDLELMINEVLKNNDDSKIRIMIVSSLSGGTGSGTFIQVALWLRKILSQSHITIRGIFLLPDVFVSTIKDIRDNKITTTRHYCNAYAAIRELNAISKICKSATINSSGRIVLDNLFDSDKDSDNGTPVYDFAFFVDDKDENGVRLDSIQDYEKMVAQLVYMQLYAPMANDMYSEEDNAFLSFVSNDEPMYGSCGTAKAVYPVNNVKMYCAIRATQDSLTNGWKKIDDEIEAQKEERRLNEQDGIYAKEEFDDRVRFVKLYEDKVNQDPEKSGKDKFFVSISKDAQNKRTRRGEDDKIIVTYSDKASDFLNGVIGGKINQSVLRHSGLDDFAIDAESFIATDHTKEELLDRIRSDEIGMEEAINNFDNQVDDYAETIVSSVFPYSMGDIREDNKDSVYGMLTKESNENRVAFIHPVAARYVLYKLASLIEKGLKSITIEDSRDEAISGGDINTLFDNSATKATEKSADEFLKSKKWFQREDRFLDDFEARYAQFITGKIALCEKYEKECLQKSVYQMLLKRINAFIDQFESFFNKLSDVQIKLDEGLKNNIQSTGSVVGKNVYVCSTKEIKEALYNSINLHQNRSNSKINKSVIDAAYGRVCAEKRPTNPDNAKYAEIGITTAFVKETLDTFVSRIEEDKDTKEAIEMDFYTAVCKQSDIEKQISDEKGKNKEIETEDVLKGLDLETRSVSIEDNERAQRHKQAFVDCKNKLFRMAAPFLTRSKEIAENQLGIINTRPKTFWGFNQKLADSCSFIGTELGINADLQKDKMYPENELFCYRAVYGLEAIYIPKFNETNNGMYYKCYRAVVDEMIKEAESKKGERALVATPHLDKTWHKILPYITPKMQAQGNVSFYQGFLLALAYGKLKLDKQDNYVISRSIRSDFGNTVSRDVLIKFNNKPIKSTDVKRLIDTLKKDEVFESSDISELNKIYENDLEDINNYVGTEVFKGLITSNDSLNPITVISRYNATIGSDFEITASLIGALERIAADLVNHYNSERSDEKLEEAKYRILQKVFSSSKRIKDKESLFGDWIKKFSSMKNSDSETD